jgi:hypothetical protein
LLSHRFNRLGWATRELSLEPKINESPHFGLGQISERCPSPAALLPSPEGWILFLDD